MARLARPEAVADIANSLRVALGCTMAIARNMAPHLMMRLSGLFFQSAQSWSIGLRFRSATGGDPGGVADIETRLNGWRDAIAALNGGRIVPTGMSDLMSSGTSITALRCSHIGQDGKETAVSLLEKNPPMLGGRAVTMPSQVAVAVTLDTGKPGASNRGRVYWPGLGAGVGPNGRQGNIDTEALAGDFAGWLHDLGNAGASIFSPGVVASVCSTTKGTANPVTQVRVGDRLDIQRRRADKENETYSVAVVPQ